MVLCHRLFSRGEIISIDSLICIFHFWTLRDLLCMLFHLIILFSLRCPYPKFQWILGKMTMPAKYQFCRIFFTLFFYRLKIWYGMTNVIGNNVISCIVHKAFMIKTCACSRFFALFWLRQYHMLGLSLWLELCQSLYLTSKSHNRCRDGSYFYIQCIDIVTGIDTAQICW